MTSVNIDQQLIQAHTYELYGWTKATIAPDAFPFCTTAVDVIHIEVKTAGCEDQLKR